MFGIFKTNLIYLVLYKNKVKVIDLMSGKFVEKNATPPFSSTRILWADYQVGENFVNTILRDFISNWGAHRMLVHPMEILEGGLSEVEKRALIDSARHMNAKEVYLMEGGAELTVGQALKKLEFLREGKKKN
jgi:actin-like ATPase involved in cell morphogenesis